MEANETIFPPKDRRTGRMVCVDPLSSATNDVIRSGIVIDGISCDEMFPAMNFLILRDLDRVGSDGRRERGRGKNLI